MKKNKPICNSMTGAGIEPAACGLKARASLRSGSPARCTISMKMHHRLRRRHNVRHHLVTILPRFLTGARVADIAQRASHAVHISKP